MHRIRLLTCTAVCAVTAVAAPPPKATPAFIPPKNDAELVEAMRRAFREPYPNWQQRHILSLLDFLTPRNEESVRNLFAEFGEQGIREDFAWNAYWRRRGEIDGEATLNLLIVPNNNLGPGHWHHEDAMDGWAAVDPAAAERWLRAHTEAQYFWAYYQRVIAAWARTDTDRATQLLFDLAKDDRYASDAMAILCDTLRLIGGNPRIATWFETLNDSGKQAAMNHAAARIKDGDVQAAARWFTTQADKPWRDDKHFHEFLNRYLASDPKAALEWVVSLPPPAGRPDLTGLQTGMRLWTLKDRAAALAWLDAHKNQKWWPRAASGVVQALREKGGSADDFLNALDTDRRAAAERELK